METLTQPKGLIYARMAAILADCTHIGKGRKNQSQGYNFRGIDDVYNELHTHFAKHEVFILPTVIDENREDRPTKNGGSMTYTVMKIQFRFVTTDGSYVDCVTVGEASDSGDKSTNKSMSTALKYALFQVFLIPTEEDKDTENHSPEFASRKQPATEPLPTAWKVSIDNLLDADSFNEFLLVNRDTISANKAIGLYLMKAATEKKLRFDKETNRFVTA